MVAALLMASCAPAVTEEEEVVTAEEVVVVEEAVVEEEEEEAAPPEEEVVVEVETSFEAAKYVNADYGFSVKGPSDWIVEELDEEALERGIVFQASATDSVPGLAVHILDAAEGTTLAEVLPTALDYPSLEIVSTSETTLANGKSATEAVVSFTAEGYPIDGWYLGVLEGDKWIIVGVYTVAQYFPIEEELALEVLHTLQFETADEDEVTFKEPTSAVTKEVADLLGIRFVASGYTVQQVLTSAFGLYAQLAILPNGDIAISDYNRRIHILSNGTIRTLVVEEHLMPAVAALPDGRICYSKHNGQIMLLDPSTNAIEQLGTTPHFDSANALVADEIGNVYAVTANRNLYRFTPDGSRTTIATDLPFSDIGHSITDVDIATDGTVYVAGHNLLIAVSPGGTITTITDDLHTEPTWCEIDPDGNVYVKDIPSGVRCLNPKTGELTPLQIYANTGVSDFLALSGDEFLFVAMGTDLIYSYNLMTNTPTPILVNTVNSFAFAVSKDDVVFLATPSLGSILKSHIIRLQGDGTKQDLTVLTFTDIQAADVDKENRLCLYTDQGFCRVEPDGSISSFTPKLLSGHRINGRTNFAVGPDGLWYCITTDGYDSIKVWSVDEAGEVTFLPITFNRTSFGASYKVGDARIDVGDDGRLALIVTAKGSKGQGPYYQRVYRADADGTNLVQIANLDSGRTGGMVDIAVGPENDVFVLTIQVGSEVIYRIDQNNTVSEFIVMGTGRDPKSIDVDPAGNVWFCTTVGVFRAAH